MKGSVRRLMPMTTLSVTVMVYQAGVDTVSRCLTCETAA